MMRHSRRTVLSAFGVALPFGLRARASDPSIGPRRPVLVRFRPFEEAVRAAFATRADGSSSQGFDGEEGWIGRRIEVGDSDLVRAGLQGCHNDRKFAGFPQGALRIVQTGFGPGPERGGARLYVSTVDVVLTSTLNGRTSSRPLDFASLPPAPLFC